MFQLITFIIFTTDKGFNLKSLGNEFASQPYANDQVI